MRESKGLLSFVHVKNRVLKRFVWQIWCCSDRFMCVLVRFLSWFYPVLPIHVFLMVEIWTVLGGEESSVIWYAMFKLLMAQCLCLFADSLMYIDFFSEVSPFLRRTKVQFCWRPYSLFTIKIYLFPLQLCNVNPQRCALLCIMSPRLLCPSKPALSIISSNFPLLYKQILLKHSITGNSNREVY